MPDPGEADPASANCQPCAVSLILSREAQVILLQSVSHQTAATGILWRHIQQSSRLSGTRDLPEHSSAILLKGQSVVMSTFLDKDNYFLYKNG